MFYSNSKYNKNNSLKTKKIMTFIVFFAVIILSQAGDLPKQFKNKIIKNFTNQI